MKERIRRIFAELPRCKVFADIGCDHGLITKQMIEAKRCEKAIISDVSKECLKKAQTLLYEYIEKGVCSAVVSNGFDNIDSCDLALIAGMGGEEIIAILKKSAFLPQNLALQPMKNVDKVRVEVVKLGYRIDKDFVFKTDGKFYDMLVLSLGEDSLTEEEILFGRTNIYEKSPAFLERLAVEKKKTLTFLSMTMPSAKKEQLTNYLKALEKYV